VVAPEVVDVRFEGNDAFPDDSLARAIVTRETECRSWILQVIPFCAAGFDFALERFELREREIPRDRVRLEIWYQRRGFREVAVDTATVARPDGRVAVEFRIEEGTPVLVDDIEFVGGDEVVGVGLLEGLPLSSGDRLSVLAADATRDTIIQRLWNRGYANADVFRQVFIPRDDPYRGRITFDIVPGVPARFGQIEVTGNQELTEGTVLRTLRFRTGDSYSVDALSEAQARLFGLEIIRNAQVVPTLESVSDSVVPVSVNVQEGDTYRVRSGAGWSTAECLNVEARWTSRNFLGGARRLQVRGRVANLLAPDFRDILCWQTGSEEFSRPTWLAAVDLVQPWIFSTRNAVTASLFLERQSLPDIFIRRTLGLQLALTRIVERQAPITISFRPERSDFDAAEILFCTGFLVCTPEDIAVLQGQNWLSPVGVNYTRNFADDLLNPTSGYRLVLDLEHAADWTASDFRYDRFAAEATWYGRITPRGVLATRLRGGWVGSGGFDNLIGPAENVDIVHPQKRFYAGGANSVRGFAQGRLGPRVLTTEAAVLIAGTNPVCTPQQLIDLTCDASALDAGGFVPRPTGGTRVLEGNLEVRFPLGGRFEGVTFTDFGQAWGQSQAISLRELELTPGVGVRFLSPVGPIRVDLAYRFRGAEALQVVVPQITLGSCSTSDVECILNENVFSGELAVLAPRVMFGGVGVSRFQLHFSIGQAF
jgi:outer membrane protein assembly factor BamA